MNPKISIIIPVYKVEKYLKRCFDSVLNQTFNDIEIIVVDEGEMDECRKIIDEYEKKDSRIIAIHEKNGGLANARNRGLKSASGEFIIFIDSDDYVEAGMFEILYNDIVSTDADFAVCGTNVRFLNFDKKLKKLNESDIEYFDIKESGVREIRNSDFGKINVGAWNKIYRKSILDKYKIEFPKNLNNEDAGFIWMYMAVSKKVYFEPKKLYNYQRRDDSLMMQTFNRNFDKKVVDHLKVVSIFYDFLVENNLYEKYCEGFWNCFQISAQYSLQYASDDKIEFFVRKYIDDFLRDKTIIECEISSEIIEYWNRYKKVGNTSEFYVKELLIGNFPILTYKYNSKIKKLILFNFIPLIEFRGEFKDVQQYKNFNNTTNI